MLNDPVDAVLNERRSLEESLGRLRARCAKRPSPRLVQMIEQLETEIASRRRRLVRTEPAIPA
jgi:hypothetical protein